MGKCKSKMTKMAKKFQKNLQQAQEDTGEVTESGTADLDVLDNDRGGKSKSIFSLDQTNPASATNEGEWVVLASGARIKFDGDQVVYDTNGAYESLAEGETVFETFTYTIQMGKGAISTAEATIKIIGQNDAPTVMDVTGMADEDGAAVNIILPAPTPTAIC
jgi:VCBS repeat-containing protein